MNLHELPCYNLHNPSKAVWLRLESLRDCPSSPAYNFPAESWKCLFPDLPVNDLQASKMTHETFLFFLSRAIIWYVSSEILSPLPGGYLVTPLEF